MLQLTTLSEARVLLVGSGVLVNEIVRNLIALRAKEIVVVGNSQKLDHKDHIQVIDREDPEAYIAEDPDYFKSFDLVTCTDQPRALELALAHLRWPNLPIIIMRGSGNNAKFRCQYEELQLKNGEISKFITLETDLSPWSDAKRALVASIFKEEFHPEQNQPFRDFLIAANAFVTFRDSTGNWPSAEDKAQIQPIEQTEAVNQYIDQFLKDGLASVPETITILARFITHDAVRLLTGESQPVNTSIFEDITKTSFNILLRG